MKLKPLNKNNKQPISDELKEKIASGDDDCYHLAYYVLDNEIIANDRYVSYGEINSFILTDIYVSSAYLAARIINTTQGWVVASERKSIRSKSFDFLLEAFNRMLKPSIKVSTSLTSAR